MTRPKRVYALPVELRPKPLPKRFGMRGFSYYTMLIIGFGSPQGYATWRLALQQGKWDIFWLLTGAWAVVISLFLVIARPWERRWYG